LSDQLSLSAWSGVVVTKVKPGSYANQFGLRPGDIIVKLNDHDIDNTQDLQKLLAQQSDQWAITINRAGQTKTLRID
jgi:S1-C subfamily serine protease